MKKYIFGIIGVAVVILLLIFGSPYKSPSQQQIIDETIGAYAEEYAAEKGCTGVINSAGDCVVKTYSFSSAASSSVVPTKTVTPWTEVVLVDQNFAQVAGKTGMERLRAMQTKVLKGTLEEAQLTFELDRGSNTKSFSAVAMYMMPYNDGVPQPQLEWKRFRFVDASWIGNCKRNLSPKSNFTTLGVQSAEGIYDLSKLPTTSEDECSTEMSINNFVNAINNEGSDFAFGFMPSDVTGNLKVTLSYKGDLKISDF